MVGQSNFAGNIAYDDLREWLAMAERLGEVRTVKGANCEEEIGLAAEAVLRAEHGPCVVFEDIPGCPKGFRLLLNMFAGTRRNMTLGFPDHLTKWELSDAYREAYLADPKIIKHEIVEEARGPQALEVATQPHGVEPISRLRGDVVKERLTGYVAVARDLHEIKTAGERASRLTQGFGRGP